MSNSSESRFSHVRVGHHHLNRMVPPTRVAPGRTVLDWVLVAVIGVALSVDWAEVIIPLNEVTK